MFDLIKEDLRTIFEKDSSAQSRLEVALCYPGFHALQFHRAAHWCYLQGWSTTARIVSSLGRFFTGVEIHPGAKIGRRVFIDHGMGVVIGNAVEIGDDCTIYQGATIGGTDIGPETGKLTIKNNVVVGAGAQILGGVTVGENAQIGPSAVVLKSVGASVSVGLPNHIVENTKDGIKSLPLSVEAFEKLQTLVKEQAEQIKQLREEKEKISPVKAKSSSVAKEKAVPKKEVASKEKTESVVTKKETKNSTKKPTPKKTLKKVTDKVQPKKTTTKKTTKKAAIKKTTAKEATKETEKKTLVKKVAAKKVAKKEKILAQNIATKEKSVKKVAVKKPQMKKAKVLAKKTSKK